MNTADRRMEIISALMHRHHSTMAELAWEFGVCSRTIMNFFLPQQYLNAPGKACNWRSEKRQALPITLPQI